MRNISSSSAIRFIWLDEEEITLKGKNLVNRSESWFSQTESVPEFYNPPSHQGINFLCSLEDAILPWIFI
jgi:hypothetical protein